MKSFWAMCGLMIRIWTLKLMVHIVTIIPQRAWTLQNTVWYTQTSHYLHTHTHTHTRTHTHTHAHTHTHTRTHIHTRARARTHTHTRCTIFSGNGDIHLYCRRGEGKPVKITAVRRSEAVFHTFLFSLVSVICRGGRHLRPAAILRTTLSAFFLCSSRCCGARRNYLTGLGTRSRLCSIFTSVELQFIHTSQKTCIMCRFFEIPVHFARQF